VYIITLTRELINEILESIGLEELTKEEE